MDLSEQKGFYDSKRQFQGHDGPEDQATSCPKPDRSRRPERGQLLFGGLFLALVVFGFVMLALPKPPPELRPGHVAPTPAAAAPKPAH